MIVENGIGDGGFKWQIDNENMGRVLAVEVSLSHHVCHLHQEAYNTVISKTPTGAGDCFFYLKNTSSKELILGILDLYAASDETVQLKLNDTGTPAGGSTNTPVNVFGNSGNTIEATCQDGVDITGLSGGNVFRQIFVDGATAPKEYDFKNAIVLPKNSIFTMYAVTGAVAIVANLTFCFHD